MKKSTLMLLVSLVLAIVLSVGSTLAYLTDTDADINTMVLGNVNIVQNEQEWREDEDGLLYLDEFNNDKPLYPYVGTLGWNNVAGYGDEFRQFTMNNVVDKYVTVTNTGKSDAYVRTIIALEMGTYEDLQSFAQSGIGLSINAEDGAEYDFPGAWVWTEDFAVEIEGQLYNVMVAEHQDPLAPGETTIPSLLQVYLNKTADNEQVEALDGNGNGKYDILVLSQAVQTAGFDNAKQALAEAFPYGDDYANVPGWFADATVGTPGTENDTNNPPVIAEITVSSNEELAKAIADGYTVIGLNTGTYNMPAAAKGKTLTLLGAGADKVIIDVIPAGQGEAGGQLDYSLDGSTVTFEDLTIRTNSLLYAGYARLSGTYNNCVIQNTYNLGVGNSEFNKCVFNITNEYLRVNGAYSAIFNQCTFNTEGRAILVFQDGTSVAQTVTVKDCTFNATASAQTWNGIHVAAVSIDGTNGTYVVNLEGTNTVDSDFNGLWQIKTGDANVTVNE